jgi:hypothetical protein
MATAPFDASKAVTFDLAHGEIRLEDEARRVLVAADALVQLCDAAGGDAVTSFGRSLGEGIARRIAGGIEGSVRDASLETVVDHLSGEWALAGLGSLHFERWGHALVVIIDHALSGPSGEGLLESTLAAAISGAAGGVLSCVRLAREEGRVRFLVTGSTGAEKVRGWLGSGVAWADALGRLQPGAPRGGAA